MKLLFKLDKDSGSRPGSTGRNRKDQVKNFVVHIDEDSTIKTSNDVPEYKGEVYFSNHPTHRKSGATGATSSARPKKRRNSSDSLVTTAFIMVIIAVSVCLALYAISCLNDVLAINRGNEIIMVNIPADVETNEIIDILAEEDLINHKVFCKVFYKLSSAAKGTGMASGLNKLQEIGYRIKVAFTGPEEPDYVSGVYYIQPNMGLEGMLYEFRQIQSAPKTVTLVFPEGWSIPQVAERLEEYNVCSADYFYKALEESEFAYGFLSGVENSDERTYRLEGYIFPSTYDFFEGENANIAIRRFLDAFEKVWTEEYDKRAKELGYSADEIITMASIIQREAADSSQMGLVSSVIHNRLKNPSQSAGRLECDSTKDYIKNYITPITDVNKVNVYNDRYNTYMAEGLPPGPVCNPGADAIEAALYPSDTNYYYFCHGKSGNIYMARTKSEHDSNVLKALSES